VPLDETDERASVRRAQIGHRQALRSYDQFEQDLVVDIRSTFRELERRKQSLDIQRQLIADQERNVKIAQILFEQGENSNRDVVEAQQSLLEARNALIREQVTYEIARLGLIRDLGILFIDEHGMWTE
jgi:outer membrane protein TolC